MKCFFLTYSLFKSFKIHYSRCYLIFNVKLKKKHWIKFCFNFSSNSIRHCMTFDVVDLYIDFAILVSRIIRN